MFSPSTFALGTFVLLVSPGPTNALLAAAGATSAERMARHRLIAAVVGGYAISVGFLTLVSGPTLAERPWLVVVLKMTAASWLLWTSVRLWRSGAMLSRSGGQIRARAVFVTTLLNPKGLVLAFGLMPTISQRGESLLYCLATLSLLSAIAATLWVSFGVFLARTGAAPMVPKATALVFGIFGALLVASSAT